MTINDGFLILIHWLHLLSALIWVGGSLFFLLVIRPAISRHDPPTRGFIRAIGEEFGSIAELCMLILLVTGAILAISRLTATYTGALYGVILTLHITLALWIFWVVWLRRRASRHRTRKPALDLVDEPLVSGRLGRTLTNTTTIVIISITVILLSEVMRLVVEKALEA